MVKRMQRVAMFQWRPCPCFKWLQRMTTVQGHAVVSVSHEDVSSGQQPCLITLGRSLPSRKDMGGELLMVASVELGKGLMALCTGCCFYYLDTSFIKLLLSSPPGRKVLGTGSVTCISGTLQVFITLPEMLYMLHICLLNQSKENMEIKRYEEKRFQVERQIGTRPGVVTSDPNFSYNFE